MKNMNINIANKSLAKANAAYLNRLSEFRGAFRSRHEISLMDDNIPKYSLYAAMDLLIEVRMARYASESVTDRHISEHDG